MRQRQAEGAGDRPLAWLLAAPRRPKAVEPEWPEELRHHPKVAELEWPGREQLHREVVEPEWLEREQLLREVADRLPELLRAGRRHHPQRVPRPSAGSGR